jgi:hypothetical protein
LIRTIGFIVILFLLALAQVATDSATLPIRKSFMNSASSTRLFFFGCLSLILAGCPSKSNSPTTSQPVSFSEQALEASVAEGFRGRVVALDQISESAVQSWKDAGWTSIAIALDDDIDTKKVTEAHALISGAGLGFDYFIEIARNPKMADEHPEWMTSLQGSDAWRRLHPDAAKPGEEEVVKTYPWINIFYAEAVAAQFMRIQTLLDKLPRPSRVWLNDVQGGPSASGCGNSLSRWTGDNGSIKTGHALSENSPADFVGRLGIKYQGVYFIPIWTTECEAEDKDDCCGGINCATGSGWESWTRQVNVLADRIPVLGVSCLYKLHDRDLARYGETAGWVKQAIGYFQSMPTTKKGHSIQPNRLVAVLQGWDVSEAEIAAQISQANAAQARGILVIDTPIDQSWKPVIHKVEKAGPRQAMTP